MESITLALIDLAGHHVCLKVITESQAEKLGSLIERDSKFYVTYDETVESNKPTLVYKEVHKPSIWSEI